MCQVRACMACCEALACCRLLLRCALKHARPPCAGTIGARNQGKGIVGVAPGIGIYALRVLRSDGNGAFSDLLRAYDHLVQRGRSLGVRVVNLSLSGNGNPSDEECSYISQLIGLGMTVVSAAGDATGPDELWLCMHHRLAKKKTKKNNTTACCSQATLASACSPRCLPPATARSRSQQSVTRTASRVQATCPPAGATSCRFQTAAAPCRASWPRLVRVRLPHACPPCKHGIVSMHTRATACCTACTCRRRHHQHLPAQQGRL